jgi:xylulokinase
MILAVDLGSTNFKAALFAEDDRRIGEASRALPYEIQTSSRAELSPESVVGCFFEVLAGTLTAAGAAADKVRRISLTSQAQTFCICDDKGNPISPLFGWTDLRAEEEAVELQGLLGDSFHRETGWPKVRPGHMLSKLLWWRKQHGLPGDHRIVSLPSYLAMQLGAQHTSDSNLAAMSGFYSIPDKRWWAGAIEAAGISARQLGLVVETGNPVSTRSESRPPGYSASLEIVFAGNDHTAGAVGCGCRKGRSVMTLGTAGVYYRWDSRAPGPFSSHGLWGPYPGDGYYELFHITHACSALDWADKYLFGSVDSPRFVDSAKKVEVDADTPFFDPERWGNDAAWSSRTNVEEMAYAVLEGIAFALRECTGEARVKDEEILILGGGSRLDLWVQLLANTFQCPFTRATHDGLDGAASLAGLSLPEDGRSKNARRFLPEFAKTGILESRYRLWSERATRK